MLVNAFRVVACLCCLVLPGLSGSSAQTLPTQDTVVFPETVAGKRVREYFRAYNSGDEAALLSFFKQNTASATQEATPMDQRMAVVRQMQADLATLDPVKIVRSEEYALTAVAQSSTGKWVQLAFEIEREPPHGIATIQIRVLREAPDLYEPTTPLTERTMQEELRGYMAGLVEKDEFSGVVLVAKGEEPLFYEAYGLASKEYNAPNLGNTRFNIGSINKLITDIAVQQLVDKGMLSLDDKMGEYLPDYPNEEAAGKVTIGQLIDMTSGISDIFGDKYVETPKDQIRDLGDYLPLFAAEPLLFEPGTSSRYSSGGYVVLGLIIERLSGATYFDYVHDNIYAPAGMHDAGHLYADVPTANVATGYTHSACGVGGPEAYWRNNIYSLPARGSSAGGGYSTAEDLARLVAALKSGTLPAPGSWKTAAADGAAAAGGAPGVNSFLGTFGPDYVIVVLSNYDPPAAERVGQRIRNMLGRLR